VPNRVIRLLALALAAAVALIVAMIAGWLAWLADNPVPAAVLTAGGAFAGTLALALVVLAAAREP